MNRILRRRYGPYLEIFRALWHNRSQAGYAWRILNRGVCDGCALGTTGLKDWTIDGVHLCWIRLNLLRLNTMGPLDPSHLARVSDLESMTEKEIRALGRIPAPLLRRAGEPGFTPIDWEKAFSLMTPRFRDGDPDRFAFYLVSRGTANETYYAAQKSARALGTSHVDNSARICHSPSTTGLKDTIGFAATTVSYRDLMGSDLVVFFGSDVANNQPVMMKYLHLAKKEGTRVAMVNPYREPGLEKYWIPSNWDSAIFGTEVVDASFTVRVGGDLAFINGVLRALHERGAVDADFIRDHTRGWETLLEEVRSRSLEEYAELSGSTVEDIRRFADLYGSARHAVLVWSMGITMHRNGVDNVRAIANLGLARGMVGREKAGLMPIRGHSGVQGGAEMGCVPNQFPGGEPVNPENAARWEERWGFPVPAERGAFVADMVNRAARGELDTLYCVGGNLLGVLPDPEHSRRALAGIPFRIHHDIVLNPQMFVEPADTVLILPATTRYEMAGGNTETSTERRIIFNPEIPGPRVAEARDEWRVLCELVRRCRPGRDPGFASTQDIRDEIGRLVPLYDGIQTLRKAGDQVQWGGPRLGEGGRFGFPDGRARFVPVSPSTREVPPGKFRLTTRRGKQFNSMVFGDEDMLVGGLRDTVVLARVDMERLGIGDGDPVSVRSGSGEMEAVARAGELHPGTVMMYWPEANVLIPRDDVDPVSGMPGYREAVVEVHAR